MKRLLFPILFIISTHAISQGDIAHFSYWKPKPGLIRQFENGYQQHLKWHQAHGDTWSWYGWSIISGERDDQFVDVTFDHQWSEYDRPRDAAGDAVDNELHTYPFAEFMGGFKMKLIRDLSVIDTAGLQMKFQRMISLTVSDIPGAIRVLKKFKELSLTQGIRSLRVFKLVDGGNLNQLLLLIGAGSWEEFGKLDDFQEELSTIELLLKVKTVLLMKSETMLFRADMTIF